MARSEKAPHFLRNTILEIKHSGRQSYPPSRPYGEETVHAHTLLYCTKGKGELILDGSSSKITRKSIMLLLPQMSFQIHPSPHHELELYALSFDLFRLAMSEDNRRVYERELSFPLRGMIEKTGSRAQYLIRRFASDAPSSKVSQSLRQLDELYELLEVLLEENPDDESPALYDQLQANPLWKGLKAVKKNQIYTIGAQPWLDYSAIGNKMAMDEAETFFR